MSKKNYYLLSIDTALMLVVFISINGSIDSQGEIYDLESQINDVKWKLEQ